MALEPSASGAASSLPVANCGKESSKIIVAISASEQQHPEKHTSEEQSVGSHLPSLGKRPNSPAPPTPESKSHKRRGGAEGKCPLCGEPPYGLMVSEDLAIAKSSFAFPLTVSTNRCTCSAVVSMQHVAEGMQRMQIAVPLSLRPELHQGAAYQAPSTRRITASSRRPRLPVQGLPVTAPMTPPTPPLPTHPSITTPSIAHTYHTSEYHLLLLSLCTWCSLSPWDRAARVY